MWAAFNSHNLSYYKASRVDMKQQKISNTPVEEGTVSVKADIKDKVGIAQMCNGSAQSNEVLLLYT